MKVKFLVLYGLCLSLMTGCQEQSQLSSSNQTVDRTLINTLNQIQVENAIVAQHCLFPYHFVTERESLNELGQRELEVLIRHLGQRGGTLTVRRGQTPVELYESRLNYVVQYLKDAGVQMHLVKIGDGTIGGKGMASEQVIEILKSAAVKPGSALVKTQTK